MMSELSFSGEDIRDSGFDGPYTVSLTLLDSDGTELDTAGFETAGYAASDFGEYAAEIVSTTDFGDDTDGDSLYDGLMVSVDIQAYQAMDYTMAGMLRIEDTFVATGGGGGFLPVGLEALEFTFDGRQISGSGLAGPYTLELQLYDSNGRKIDEGTFETNPYGYDDFDPAARVTGPFDDYGEDTNGNSQFDSLVFEATVDVSEAGDYDVLGWLQDSLGETITWADTSVTLAVGSQVVTLCYDGLDVNRHRVDGPYLISHLAVTEDDGSFVTSAADLHTTNAYSFEDFERFGDLDADTDVDLEDYSIFAGCLMGPDHATPPIGCDRSDLQGDLDVDLADFSRFQRAFTGQ